MEGKRLFPLAAIVMVVGAVVVYPIATNLTSDWVADLLKASPWLAPLLWTLFVVFVALSLFLWRREQTARWRDEFKILVPSEQLSPVHLGFEVVSAGVEPADTTRRPFVQDAYVPRVAIRYDESHLETPRTFNEIELRTMLEEGRSILLMGQPTEGKTRTLYEIAKALKGYLVVQPKERLPSTEAMKLLQGKKVLCLFDDINAAIEKRIDPFEFYQAVQQVAGYRALAAACRDGDELEALKRKLTTSPLQKLYEGSYRFVLRRASKEEKASLARMLGQAEGAEYLNLGDVSMRGAFELMQQRFERLEELDRQCLWSMQLMAASGVEQLSRRRILAVLNHQYGRGLHLPHLREPLMRLRNNGFLVGRPDDDPVVPEAAFVAGPRAQRNYRDGVEPEGDLPRLIEALRIERDAKGLLGVALHLYRVENVDGAIALWTDIFQSFSFSKAFHPSL
jgi:hypothetical protein